MNIILLTEGNVIEDEIILSRVPNKYKLDRSILSKNVPTTNFFKYDLIIISFVPSFGTPHFRLIESVLRLKKNVVSMNMDQNKFHFDYAFRSNSFECLCKLGLKLFAINDNFEEFLAKLRLSHAQLEIDDFYPGDEVNNETCSSNNLIFVVDMKWLSASDEYIRYKRSVGYSDSAIRGAINYSSRYMESIVANHEEIIKKLQFKKAYIHIDSLYSFKEIEEKYRGKLLSNIEIVDAHRFLELLLEGSTVLTNWHGIELINYRENIKNFRINFYYQKSINIFNQVLSDHSGNEKFSNIPDDKFELVRVKSNPVVIDIEAVYYGGENFEEDILSNPGTSIGSTIDIYYLVRNCIFLIVTQLRFLPYTFKTMLKNI